MDTKSATRQLIEQLGDWRIDASFGLQDTSVSTLCAALSELKHTLNGDHADDRMPESRNIRASSTWSRIE